MESEERVCGRVFGMLAQIVVLVHHVTSTGELCSDVGFSKASVGDGCIFIPPEDASWFTAKQLCSLYSHGSGQLIRIDSAEKWLRIKGALERLNLTRTEFWIGGRLEAARWHWAPDRTPLTCYVGCCSFIPKDLPSTVKHIYDNSAGKCTRTCRMAGYNLAYVQHNECVCSNHHCEADNNKDGCRKSCPGNNQDTCGDASANLFSVYSVPDTDVFWRYNCPSHAGISFPEPGKACGAVTRTARGLVLVDRFCEATSLAICQYHSQKRCDLRISKVFCMRIVQTMSTWFEARATCRAEGGDLAITKGHNSLNVSALSTGRYYWVGLWRLESTWTSGDDIVYRPDALIKLGCLSIMPNYNMTWSADTCSRSKRFICEKRMEFSTHQSADHMLPSSVQSNYECPSQSTISGERKPPIEGNPVVTSSSVADNTLQENNKGPPDSPAVTSSSEADNTLQGNNTGHTVVGVVLGVVLSAAALLLVLIVVYRFWFRRTKNKCRSVRGLMYHTEDIGLQYMFPRGVNR